MHFAPRLAPEPSSTVVVYCASDTCRNSHTAAALLRTLGYHDVRVYEGGKADWRSARLTLKTLKMWRVFAAGTLVWAAIRGRVRICHVLRAQCRQHPQCTFLSGEQGS